MEVFLIVGMLIMGFVGVLGDDSKKISPPIECIIKYLPTPTPVPYYNEKYSSGILKARI